MLQYAGHSLLSGEWSFLGLEHFSHRGSLLQLDAMCVYEKHLLHCLGLSLYGSNLYISPRALILVGGCEVGKVMMVTLLELFTLWTSCILGVA